MGGPVWITKKNKIKNKNKNRGAARIELKS